MILKQKKHQSNRPQMIIENFLTIRGPNIVLLLKIFIFTPIVILRLYFFWAWRNKTDNFGLQTGAVAALAPFELISLIVAGMVINFSAVVA